MYDIIYVSIRRYIVFNSGRSYHKHSPRHVTVEYANNLPNYRALSEFFSFDYISNKIKMVGVNDSLVTENF